MDPNAFREALKNFPSGVTIVTTADEEGNPLGATVSSFASLSLEPPLVLVCLSEHSRTVRAIRARRAFAVHILDRSQHALARRFASDGAAKFEGADFRFNAAGVPCLTECRALLECRLHGEYAGGDHLILVGRVEAARQAPEFEPLVYAQRSFFGLGTRLIES